MRMAWLIPLAVACAIVAVSIPASAQNVVEARIEMTLEPPRFQSKSEIPPGETTQSSLKFRFCYGQGGANPAGDEMEIAFTIDAYPDFALVVPQSDTSFKFTSATGPGTAGDNCENVPTQLFIVTTIDPDAAPQDEGDITITAKVDVAIGTMMKPDDVTQSVKVVVATPVNDSIPEPVEGDPELTDLPPTEKADSPFAAAAWLTVGTLVAVAFVRRRRLA